MHLYARNMNLKKHTKKKNCIQRVYRNTKKNLVWGNKMVKYIFSCPNVLQPYGCIS